MPILRTLLVLFILVPVLEIYLLIKVGGVIGAWSTVLLVVFTALLGATLLRHQGLYTMARVQNSLAAGEVPTVAMIEGVILLVAGALLLTPGFFTDAIGFLALIPPLRRAAIHALLQRALVQVVRPGHRPHDPSQGPQRAPHHTIEGEYTRDDDQSR